MSSETCKVCEGACDVIYNASVYSTGPIRIEPCPDCGGTGIEATRDHEMDDLGRTAYEAWIRWTHAYRPEINTRDWKHLPARTQQCYAVIAAAVRSRILDQEASSG